MNKFKINFRMTVTALLPLLFLSIIGALLAKYLHFRIDRL